jgi:hypothetical protein
MRIFTTTMEALISQLNEMNETLQTLTERL